MIEWFPLEASTGRWKMTTRNAETKFMGGVRNHLAPRLPMPLKELTPYLVESALTAIFKQHREIAKGLRAWVCSYLKWAEDEGILENGRWMAAQVRQDLTELWRRLKHGQRLHRAALPFEKAPAFYAELDTVAGTAAQACKMAILTCMRTSSVIHMRWKDINFQEKTWTCPAEFMKESGNGVHVVYSREMFKGVFLNLHFYVEGQFKQENETFLLVTCHGDVLLKVYSEEGCRQSHLNDLRDLSQRGGHDSFLMKKKTRWGLPC